MAHPLTLTTGLGRKTIARVLKRLRGSPHRLRESRGGSGRGFQAFAPVQQSDTIRSTLSTVSLSGVTLRAPLASQKSLPVETPCFRRRGYVGKTRGGLLNALECYGPQSTDELAADRLGFSRVRDMRRRHLTPLPTDGIDTAGGRYTYGLVDQYAERVSRTFSMPSAEGAPKGTAS